MRFFLCVLILKAILESGFWDFYTKKFINNIFGQIELSKSIDISNKQVLSKFIVKVLEKSSTNHSDRMIKLYVKNEY